MESFLRHMEHGTASVRAYLYSVEVRGDTKLALLFGALAGLAIVAVIAAYPGKPIDYTGVGIDLPPEMRGGRRAVEAAGKSDKHDGEQSCGTADQQRQTGLLKIHGVVDSLSKLRRRKAAHRTTEARASAAGEESFVHNSTEDGGGKVEGDWDARRLDEDKLARKVGSSKAARMLGLTEHQVRQAVLDAKEELEQSGSKSAAHSGRDNGNDQTSLSGLLSLVMLSAGLCALWVYLTAHPHGSLSRFLIGVFPREMETLGLVPS